MERARGRCGEGAGAPCAWTWARGGWQGTSCGFRGRGTARAAGDKLARTCPGGRSTARQIITHDESPRMTYHRTTYPHCTTIHHAPQIPTHKVVLNHDSSFKVLQAGSSSSRCQQGCCLPEALGKKWFFASLLAPAVCWHLLARGLLTACYASVSPWPLLCSV